MVKKQLRVVLTGGPGAGKSTVAQLAAFEFPKEALVLPEAATLVYSNGFVHSKEASLRRINQRVIFEYQRGLENLHSNLSEKRLLICDRGSLDGSAYWPGGLASFCKAMDTDLQTEYSRYDCVLFFETAALGGIKTFGNPTRRESAEGAIALDRSLRKIWGGHPNLVVISHRVSFAEKIVDAIGILRALLQAR